MTTTKISKIAIRKAAVTKLEKAVASWIVRTCEGYDDGPAGRMRDLFHGGCASGIVGPLCYTNDCVRFYERHQRDIMTIACDQAENQGYMSVFGMLGQCNHNNPCDYDQVANFLAWYGFEEAARTIADRVGYDD